MLIEIIATNKRQHFVRATDVDTIVQETAEYTVVFCKDLRITTYEIAASVAERISKATGQPTIYVKERT